jgi:RNA polymerase-binding transcription factor DksA
MLTQAQKYHYRERLEDMMVEVDRGRQRLTRETLRSMGDDAGTALATVLDAEALISHRAEEEVSLQLMDAEEHAIREIQDALDRLAHGTFGRCEVCRELIPAKRLGALPHTRYCIRCARRMEEGIAS